MQWFFKVTFIATYCVVLYNCRSLRKRSEDLQPQYKDPSAMYYKNRKSREPPSNSQQVRSNHDLLSRSFARDLETSLGEALGLVSGPLRSKVETKRGLNLGIHLHLPTTKGYDTKGYETNLEKIENILEQALAGRLAEGSLNSSAECPSCEEEEIIIKRTLKPAYKCDEWNSQHRVCILERNIGDTVTFYLAGGGHTREATKANVTWKKEFHIRGTSERREFVIEPENPPENVIIGRKGYELRISPITETDVEYNMFSATVASPTPTSLSKVYFMIRIVPIDLGFIYVGETVELNLRKFVSLPVRSLNFKWYMEKDGEHGTLPSNMKVSTTGSSIKISELRQEQEGILACSVYTNLHFLATKKRFLMKDLVKHKDVLQSSPNHTLIFKEEDTRQKRDRKKLFPLLSSLKTSDLRLKRETDLAEEIEKALLESTPAEKTIPGYTTDKITTRYYSYDLDMESPYGSREQQPFADSGGFQEISEGADVSMDLPEERQMDMPIDKVPMELEEPVEGQRVPYDPKPINEELSLDTDVISNDMNAEDTGFVSNPESNPESLPDLRVQSKDTSTPKEDYADVVLNFERFGGPRKITAEEKIGKLISSCFSDIECSVSGICVRPSLKNPGFCKCLPENNGVGIFCREQIWLSNSNFDIEERNSDYMTYQRTNSV